jgi:hypothetical protein
LKYLKYELVIRNVEIYHSLAKKVEAKVVDFDIRINQSRELLFPDPSKPGDISLIVNEQNVREAINSFPAGSSPGLDGMRPQFLGNHLISSSVGAQQGDSCGPMIFSLTIQPIILSLDSQLNIWYLDDRTLADYPEVVFSDFKKVINLSREIGLELNKCQIFCCSGGVFFNLD